MTMMDAPSDRDYQEFLNPSEQEQEEPQQEERKSWVYAPCYSIAYLNLPKVERVGVDEECPF